MKMQLVASAALLALVAGACTREEEPTSRMRRITAEPNAIVGGDVIAYSEFPEVALIIHDQWICTGTLIDDFVILTAAHCVEDANESNYQVCGGDDPFGQNGEGGCYWLNPVESVHEHPNYDSQNISNDLGIIVLDPDPQYGSPADQDPNLKPLPFLADDPGDNIYKAGTTFTAVGFGITESGSGDGIKRKVGLSIEDVYLDVFEYGTSTANTCSGDSGGPAIKSINGDPTVIGVVSYGDQNCTQFGGDSRTDYAPFRDFIESYAGAGATPTPGPGDDDDDDDDGAGDDDDDGANPGNGGDDGDDPFGGIGCSIASVANSSAAPMMLLGLAFVAAITRRKRE